MKFLLELRTPKKRYCIFGLIFELKRPAIEYLDDSTRSTIAIIPPQRSAEGIAFKLWGYDKVTHSILESGGEQK